MGFRHRGQWNAARALLQERGPRRWRAGGSAQLRSRLATRTLTGKAVEDGAVDAREAAREVVEGDDCEEPAAGEAPVSAYLCARGAPCACFAEYIRGETLRGVTKSTNPRCWFVRGSTREEEAPLVCMQRRGTACESAEQRCVMEKCRALHNTRHTGAGSGMVPVGAWRGCCPAWQALWIGLRRRAVASAENGQAPPGPGAPAGSAGDRGNRG
jgi:hypothetical protein